MTPKRAIDICAEIESKDYRMKPHVYESADGKFSVRVAFSFLGRYQLDQLLEIASGRTFHIETADGGMFTVVIG